MKITVCVCTFGDRAWTAKADAALRSVDGQDAYQAYAWHANRGTLAAARNAAGSAAGGDWLCFLDADDSLAPGYLDAMRAIPDPDWLTLIVPAVQYVRDGLPAGVPEVPAWDRNLLEINCAVIGTLISRSLFLRVGGFREWETLEDWELWLRCVRLGAKMRPAISAVYRATLTDGSRNADQSPYERIRAEHGTGFDWANVDAYKVQPWQT